MVVYSLPNPQSEILLYQMKKFVEDLMLFYMHGAKWFSKLEEARDFLDLPANFNTMVMQLSMDSRRNTASGPNVVTPRRRARIARRGRNSEWHPTVNDETF
jgi:hypothetical protein